MAVMFQQKFSWRANNRFQLLVDGGEIFPAMLESIRTAKSRIFLEMYLVESGALFDQFIVALSAAAQRGVDVYLLFDDYGSRGLTSRDRRRITQAGIQMRMYNPIRFGWYVRNLFRDHRKLLIVDLQQAFVGGVGLTDAFDVQSNPQNFWHDVAIRIEGSVVADWYELFRHNWRRCAKQDLPLGAVPSVGQTDNSARQAGRVAGATPFGALSIYRSFRKRMRNAERRVWMMTAYFVPSHSLLRALRKSARRGVDVRLLLPGPAIDHPSIRYASHQYYYSLLRAGVRIFEYQPRFLHAKVLLCDDWVSLGSSNIDRWNLRWNLEANQEVEDSLFAARSRELFEANFALSEECLLENWQLRSRFRRVLEWFWGKVGLLLERYSLRIRRKK